MSPDEYASTTTTFEAESAPEVVETVEIEGQKVEIVRYATMTRMPATIDEAPEFGRSERFAAIPAGAEIRPLCVSFYVNAGRHHKAGAFYSGLGMATATGEYGRRATVKAAIKAAADRIERDRLHAQYAPVAEANIGTHTAADFLALDADADIAPGDLVVVYSHQRYRTGVAIKVTEAKNGKTRVECLAATPTGGYAQGTKGNTKGEDVRLLRKATPATPAAPAGEQTTPDPAAPVEWPAGKKFRDQGAPAEPALEGAAPAAPALDEAEERRIVSGRLFASMQGMAAATEDCNLYRMVRARVGARQLRIHDDAGELLGTVTEVRVEFRGTGFRAETPDGAVLPAGDDGLFDTFRDAVAAVRAAAANQDDDQGATEAAREGEDMGQTEAPAMDPADAEGWGLAPEEGPESRDCVRVSTRRTATGREQWCATHRAWEPIEDEGDAPAGGPDREAVDVLLALVAARGVDPATLRAVADQVERDRAGHVTEIEVDAAGHFEWRCVQGDAEQTGLEVGEEAYKAATAHGPLVATSAFARRPVTVHQGRGDNDRGVPRRTLAGALQWEDQGDWCGWRVAGWSSTEDIDEEDIAGAQAWAARVIADSCWVDRVTVAGWEHHRDDYGDWWEPVIR